MKSLSTDILPTVKLDLLSPGEIFIWDHKICTYISSTYQVLCGSGEKLTLKGSTLVWPICYEISIDGVRQWIRNGIKFDRKAQKEVTPLERLVLLNEING